MVCRSELSTRNIINMTLKNKIIALKNLIEMKQITLNDPKFDMKKSLDTLSQLLFCHQDKTFPLLQEIGHLILCLDNPLVLLFVGLNLNFLTFKVATFFHFTPNTTLCFMRPTPAKLAQDRIIAYTLFVNSTSRLAFYCNLSTSIFTIVTYPVFSHSPRFSLLHTTNIY